MSKERISVDTSYAAPCFEMVISVPCGCEADKYIDGLLELILKEQFYRNAKWDFQEHNK